MLLVFFVSCKKIPEYSLSDAQILVPDKSFLEHFLSVRKKWFTIIFFLTYILSIANKTGFRPVSWQQQG